MTDQYLYNITNTYVTTIRRAPQPAQIAHEESSIGSLIDVDSPHVSSVTSDYSGETDTQMKREEHEAKEAEQNAKDKFKEIEGEAAKKYEKGKGYAKDKGKKAEASTKKGGKKLSDNRTNPVVVGNAIVVGVGSALLGFVYSLLASS